MSPIVRDTKLVEDLLVVIQSAETLNVADSRYQPWHEDKREKLASPTPNRLHTRFWHEDRKMLQDFALRIGGLWENYRGPPFFHR